MYDVSDAYDTEPYTDRGSLDLSASRTWSHRLIVAVFSYWHRVRRVVDWSWQFFVVGVEPSHANSVSWRHASMVTCAQYP